MDHPKKEITHIIHSLTTSPPSAQKAALETYFTPSASFTHPFCRVPSFSHLPIPFSGSAINSRWVIWCIYRWYKILSPSDVLDVEVVEFNQRHNILFLQVRQVFTLFFLPTWLYSSDVRLVCKLQLVHTTPPDSDSTMGAGKKYYISHQEDLYQTSEFVKFLLPGAQWVVWVWQILATVLCVLGAMTGAPLMWVQQRRAMLAGKGKETEKNGMGILGPLEKKEGVRYGKGDSSRSY